MSLATRISNIVRKAQGFSVREFAGEVIPLAELVAYHTEKVAVLRIVAEAEGASDNARQVLQDAETELAHVRAQLAAEVLDDQLALQEGEHE